MSNSQRRREQRHAGKRRPGLHTEAVQAAQQEVAEFGRKLQGVAAMRRQVLDEARREENGKRAVPVSGAARRRAKAARNANASREPVYPGTLQDLQQSMIDGPSFAEPQE